MHDPDCELISILRKDDELLRRQVHNANRDADTGRVLSAAFVPRKDENGEPSHLRGWVACDEAHRRYTSTKAANGKFLESDGTWCVSVAEAKVAGLDAYDDSARPGSPADHCFFEFDPGWSRGKTQSMARKLAEAAERRGPCYLAPKPAR